MAAAANPTPTGNKPTDEVSQRAMDQYLSKISGPLIDRVDIHIEVPAVPYKQLTGKANGTSSNTLRKQVLAARDIQSKRNGGPLYPNSRLTGRQLDNLAPLDDASQLLLREAMQSLGLSARAYDKVRRVAHTIADLESREHITVDHVAEAIQYRLLDRQL